MLEVTVNSYELKSSIINGAISVATSVILSSPVPATGWGSLIRGTSGIPVDVAKKSPCGQNSSVTKATAGTPKRAIKMLSRTVPEVQLPQ